MPPITFALCICVSIIFGFVVASFLFKSDRANVYQKGRNEGEEERASLKEKVQAKETKLAEIAKEREMERQSAEALRTELEVLKSTGGAPGGLDDGRLQELKTAFEEKTAELLRAEQESSEAQRTQAAQKIEELEERLTAAEAACTQAREEAQQARSEAAAMPGPLADLSHTDVVPASEVETRIEQAVAAARESASQELASVVEQLAAAKAELESALQELAASQEQAGLEEASRNSSNEAVAAVNTELVRLHTALEEAQGELDQARQAREAAEAALREAEARVTAPETESVKASEFQARIAELEEGQAQAAATEAQLRADTQTLRDEIAEWRRLYEEAEMKNLEGSSASNRQVEEASERAAHDVAEARATAQQEAEAKLVALQQEAETKLAALQQETEAKLAAVRQEAEGNAAAKLAEAQQEAEAQLAAVRQDAETKLATQQQESDAKLAAAHHEAVAHAEAKLAEAIAARDEIHQEALRQSEAALAEARSAAAAANSGASSEELAALRELVLRLEGGLGEVARDRNGAIESLTGEVANLRQIAALSRAVCDGAVRYATQAEELRANFEAAMRVFHQGATAFASDVLGPVRQLQTALPSAGKETPAAAATGETGAIEALQQAVEAPVLEALAEA